MKESFPSSRGHVIICLACDAESPVDLTVCWLCNAPLNDTITTAELVSEPPEKLGTANSDQVAIIVTVLIMSIVVVGVFAAAPGFAVPLGVVVALAMIALFKASKDGVPPQTNAKTINYAYKESTDQSAVARQNRVLNILLIVLSSIVALLVSVIGIAALMVIAMIAAFASFCESCFGLLQPPG